MIDPVVAVMAAAGNFYCWRYIYMKEKEIIVLMVEPGKHPVVTTIKNDLDSLQKAVSIGADYQGLIEIIGIEDGIVLLCNEEGKLLGLEGNRKVGNDIITGVFYIVAEDGHGDLASLPKAAIEKYKERFWEPEEYSQSDVEHAMFMRFFCL